MKTLFDVGPSTWMKMSEKKDRVLNYLQAAKIEDNFNPLRGCWRNGWRSPTEIGREALGAVYYNASQKACKVLPILVSEGMVERKKPGVYRIKEVTDDTEN